MSIPSLEEQVRFRWADIPENRTLVISRQAVDECRQIRHVGILDLDNRRYFSPKEGGVSSKWNDDAQVFVENNPERDVTLARRQTRFANLCHSWKLRGKFVTNWHDAQGWNYQTILPSLHGTPIIQFSRRRSQRGQVVLLPLAWNYMGPGGPNLPSTPDPIPFRAKQDKLIWRGRCTGVVPLEGTRLWWAVSSFRETAEETTRQFLPKTARWQVTNGLRHSPLADVKFTLNEAEQAAIARTPFLQNLFDGITGPRLSQEEQRQAKFLLVVDGNDIGSNKYWSLLSNSVTLIVESEWESALDVGLLPWVHYVPVSGDPSSIETTMEALLRQPRQCEEMIRAAHEHLMPQLNISLREAVDYATLHRYQQQVLCCADLPMTWSLARR